MTKTNSLGIYIHIPFCLKKCRYCDFISFDQQSPSQWQEYGVELNKEIHAYGESLKGEYIVDTIFFGGGTPSLISPTIIKGIITQIGISFQKESNPEITIEANPGTISEENLESYLEAGINRLSIGMQSFDNALLMLLGRIHDANEARESYRLARRMGFKNISLDLMFGIPTQSLQKWESSLMEAVELNPEHISFYGLSYEEGTPFDDARKCKELIPISEDIDREMYRKGLDILLANGYEQYEISNMAKPGYSCKHNLKYWSMEEYLGLGIGAHSFLKGKRLSNTGEWKRYFSTNKIKEEHVNSEYDNMSEYIFTGMRKTKGINFKNFKDSFGLDYFEYIGKREEQLFKYRDKGLLKVNAEGMYLTEKGIDVSNMILADLM